MAMLRIPTLLEVEQRHILNVLHLCGNNRTRTAKILGISVRGLRAKLDQYKKVGFAIPVPPTREVRGEIDEGGD
jgi:DNA-binding NtrC family response regulator